MTVKIPEYETKLELNGYNEYSTEHSQFTLPFYADIFLEMFGNSDREKTAIIMYNQTGDLVGTSILAVGVEDSVTYSSKVLLRTLINSHCTQFVIAHNHPSGICKASEQDLEAFRQLDEAISPLGFHMMANLIINDKGEYHHITKEEVNAYYETKANHKNNQNEFQTFKEEKNREKEIYSTLNFSIAIFTRIVIISLFSIVSLYFANSFLNRLSIIDESNQIIALFAYILWFILSSKFVGYLFAFLEKAKK